MFFLLPVGVDYAARRYPVVTFTLMGVNIVVYLGSLLYEWNGGPEAAAWLYENLWLIPEQSRWHTFFTSMFVHGGFFHLLGNMIYLFLFGACVEDTIGRWQFSLFYLLGGLAACLAHIAVSADHFASMIPMGGASGAVTACIGGFVWLLRRAKINFVYFYFIVFRFGSGDFWLPSWLVISFWFLKDLLYAALSYWREEIGAGVAFGAHVGGFLAGSAMIGCYKVWRRVKGPREELAGAASLDSPPAPPAAAVGDEPANIYLYEKGQQLGPYTATQVTEMLKLGSIDDSVDYWYEGMPGWRSVSELR
jgi:membrane associated rhomboid family serine protease